MHDFERTSDLRVTLEILIVKLVTGNWPGPLRLADGRYNGEKGRERASPTRGTEETPRGE